MQSLFRSAVLLALCRPGLAQTAGVSYVIDTVAGSDFLQDNGQAVDTWLWQPEGVAVSNTRCPKGLKTLASPSQGVKAVVTLL